MSRNEGEDFSFLYGQESITNYSHVLWLMKENGYTEDSFAFHEFTDRINEVRQLKAQAAATE